MDGKEKVQYFQNIFGDEIIADEIWKNCSVDNKTSHRGSPKLLWTQNKNYETNYETEYIRNNYGGYEKGIKIRNAQVAKDWVYAIKRDKLFGYHKDDKINYSFYLKKLMFCHEVLKEMGVGPKYQIKFFKRNDSIDILVATEFINGEEIEVKNDNKVQYDKIYKELIDAHKYIPLITDILQLPDVFKGSAIHNIIRTKEGNFKIFDFIDTDNSKYSSNLKINDLDTNTKTKYQFDKLNSIIESAKKKVDTFFEQNNDIDNLLIGDKGEFDKYYNEVVISINKTRNKKTYDNAFNEVIKRVCNEYKNLDNIIQNLDNVMPDTSFNWQYKKPADWKDGNRTNTEKIDNLSDIKKINYYRWMAQDVMHDIQKMILEKKGEKYDIWEYTTSRFDFKYQEINNETSPAIYFQKPIVQVGGKYYAITSISQGSHDYCGTYLFNAVVNTQPDWVLKLTKLKEWKKFGVNKWEEFNVNKYEPFTGNNPLLAACAKGRNHVCSGGKATDKMSDIVSILLDNPKIDTNAPDFHSGMTPAHYAVLHGDYELLLKLEDQGANLNKKDYSGKTPLDYAKMEMSYAQAKQVLKNSCLWMREGENTTFASEAEWNKGFVKIAKKSDFKPLSNVMYENHKSTGGGTCGTLPPTPINKTKFRDKFNRIGTARVYTQRPEDEVLSTEKIESAKGICLQVIGEVVAKLGSKFSNKDVAIFIAIMNEISNEKQVFDSDNDQRGEKAGFTAWKDEITAKLPKELTIDQCQKISFTIQQVTKKYNLGTERGRVYTYKDGEVTEGGMRSYRFAKYCEEVELETEEIASGKRDSSLRNEFTIVR